MLIALKVSSNYLFSLSKIQKLDFDWTVYGSTESILAIKMQKTLRSNYIVMLSAKPCYT